MGQQNDKVVFGDQTQLNTRKRDKIFNKIYTVKAGIKDHVRESPFCNCPENMQSSNIINQSQKCPTCKKMIRRKQEIEFDSEPRCKKPLRKIYNFSDQKRTYPVQEENPIYYYNAWSLPTQKCFVEKSEKNFSQRNVTESVIEPDYNYGMIPEEPIRSPKKEQPYKPSYGEESMVERYDFSMVKNENRMQNLFLFDKN